MKMGRCFLSGFVFLFCLSANGHTLPPAPKGVHPPTNWHMLAGSGSPLGIRGQKCLSANGLVAVPFSTPLELQSFEHRLSKRTMRYIESHRPLSGDDAQKEISQKDTLKPRPAPDSLFLKLRPLMTVERAAKFVTADPLGNFYIVTPENEVQKLDSTGQVQFRFSNNRLGDITFFDASNAFNLLVFYQDFNVVQVLDRTLSESGQFNLYDAGILQPQCLTLADEKNLWVYDPDNFQLKKIDKVGATIIASQQLNLIFEEAISPTLLKEVGNEVYLMDSKNGIYIFDAFGRFLKKDQITDLFNFLPMKMKYLIFRKDKMVVRSRRDGWEQERHYLPFLRKEGKIQVAGTNLFWLKEESVEVFSF